MSDSLKPVHAGLVANDCLILLDERTVHDPLLEQPPRSTNTAGGPIPTLQSCRSISPSSRLPHLPDLKTMLSASNPMTWSPMHSDRE